MAKFDEDGRLYVDASEVTSGLYDFAVFTRRRLRDYMNDKCLDLEVYMKNNRPWQDRTGNARRGLKAEFVDDKPADSFKELQIKVMHTVEYGVFLEYNGEFNPSYLPRRRPILVPTMEKQFPEIIRGMQGILKKLAW